jgi:hypothetical protein
MHYFFAYAYGRLSIGNSGEKVHNSAIVGPYLPHDRLETIQKRVTRVVPTTPLKIL